MDYVTIKILLMIISFILTSTIGLYINYIFHKKKKEKEFFKKINNIVGLGGKVLYSVNMKLNVFEVQEINRNGMIVKNTNKSIFIPIKKLMDSEIIIPESNYEETYKQKFEEEQVRQNELEEFKQKRIAEITANVNKQMITNHLLPEIKNLIIQSIEENEGELSDKLENKMVEILRRSGYDIKKKEDGKK